MSFWVVPAQLPAVEPLRPADGDIVGEQRRRGRVYRHRRADRAEGYAAERVHHVAHGRYGHADLADLALGLRRVGVVPYLGRQVERHAQAGLALFEHELEALVRLRRVAEPRVLPHRPEAVAVHAGVDAARERVRAGPFAGGRVPGPRSGARPVHRLYLKVRVGGKPLFRAARGGCLGLALGLGLDAGLCRSAPRPRPRRRGHYARPDAGAAHPGRKAPRRLVRVDLPCAHPAQV